MSSVARAIVALLPACNSVLGLREVDPSPTPYFDAPIDASPMCPPVGTPPRFLPIVRQYVQQSCRDYSVSASGTAVASCRNDTGYQVAIGVPGQPLELVAAAAGTNLFRPRLSIDDQRLYVADVAPAVREYTRVGAAWQLTRTVTELGGDVMISAIARSPTGDRIVAASGTTFHEWERGADDTWHLLPTTLPITDSINGATMTTDGLRLLAETSVAIVYADRPDTSSSFGALQILPDVPVFEDPFMTEDCARIYATGLTQIAYIDGR